MGEMREKAGGEDKHGKRNEGCGKGRTGSNRALGLWARSWCRRSTQEWRARIVCGRYPYDFRYVL